ncbi:hypothetical protein D3C81_1669150 [compost metagenome]
MRFLLHMEPKDQAAAAKMISTAPSGLAWRLEPRLSRPMPARPRRMPAHSRRLVRWPQISPNSRANSGTVATARAATPEATPRSSARVTPPLPQLSRRKPMAAADFHSCQLGLGAPRQRR